MKCCITGHARGIGKAFYDHFTAVGWQVVGFDKTVPLSDVIEQSTGCDLFINNAYENQLSLFNQLYASVGKMIVCGSVVTDLPDPSMPEYSTQKQDLETRFLEVADYAPSHLLLLKLSSDVYNNSNVVLKTVDFWLETPQIKVVTFVAKEEPNR